MLKTSPPSFNPRGRHFATFQVALYRVSSMMRVYVRRRGCECRDRKGRPSQEFPRGLLRHHLPCPTSPSLSQLASAGGVTCHRGTTLTPSPTADGRSALVHVIHHCWVRGPAIHRTNRSCLCCNSGGLEWGVQNRLWFNNISAKGAPLSIFTMEMRGTRGHQQDYG